ncbi:MAG: 30S ribosomal protein S18 [Nitrospina sp.]|jgi:small subunit ribosomal protein S18|nr:30S ribosomal protein S18 [Nitrospina sp.]MBT6602251.1 30S ribosomal protein S18 [Nitrospina sp.]
MARKTRNKVSKSTRKKTFTQKICRFCADKVSSIIFYDIKSLKPLISERGKIIPSRISGNCAKHQRAVTTAIKRARCIALLPFSEAH